MCTSHVDVQPFAFILQFHTYAFPDPHHIPLIWWQYHNITLFANRHKNQEEKEAFILGIFVDTVILDFRHFHRMLWIFEYMLSFFLFCMQYLCICVHCCSTEKINEIYSILSWDLIRLATFWRLLHVELMSVRNSSSTMSYTIITKQ